MRLIQAIQAQAPHLDALTADVKQMTPDFLEAVYSHDIKTTFSKQTVYITMGTGRVTVPKPDRSGFSDIWVAGPDAWFGLDGSHLTEDHPDRPVNLMVATPGEAGKLFSNDMKFPATSLMYCPRDWFTAPTTAEAGLLQLRNLVNITSSVFGDKQYQALTILAAGLVPMLRDKLRLAGTTDMPLMVVCGPAGSGKSTLTRLVQRMSGKPKSAITQSEYKANSAGVLLVGSQLLLARCCSAMLSACACVTCYSPSTYRIGLHVL